MCLQVILIALISAWFRVSYFQQTIIDIPVRGDAAHYVQYASNIINYGTFSKSSGSSSPAPDSFWAPGYPTFLAFSIIVAEKLNRDPYTVVMYFQVFLGVLISILTLSLGRTFLGEAWSILPALLVSVSPHLISIGGYLLSETLYSFMLLAAMYSLSRAFIEKKGWLFTVSGFLFGLAYLVNPVMFFTPIFLIFTAGLVLRYTDPGLLVSLKYNLISCLMVFFLIVGAWSVRNMVSVPSGQPSGRDRLLINLIIGTHSDYYDIYLANPRNPNNPADMDSKNIKGSYAAFTSLLLERAAKDPGHYAKWYLIDKPILLWSWDILMGQGDIYIYPVKISFFDKSKIALAVHILMKAIHYWILAFSLMGMIFLFKGSGPSPIVPLFLYITVIYISAVYVVTQAEPRYSIPLRPEMFLCAGFFFSKVFENRKAMKFHIGAN